MSMVTCHHQREEEILCFTTINAGRLWPLTQVLLISVVGSSTTEDGCLDTKTKHVLSEALRVAKGARSKG